MTGKPTTRKPASRGLLPSCPDRAAKVAERIARALEPKSPLASLADLDVLAQLPEAPWFPSNPEGYSARWILLHIIEELARHAGHADIIRESIDGATMYELMAGAEGWPETDWLKPWRPKASVSSST